MRLSHGHCAVILAALFGPPVRAEWTFHSIPLTNVSVYDIAAREDTLYMFSSLPRGLFRSWDEGATWALLDSGLTGDYFGVAADGKEVFYFGSSPILRSRDNGDSWERADRGAEGAFVRGIFPLGSVLYAATEQGTYRSADRGDSWKRVFHGGDQYFTSITAVNGVLFASCITLNQDSSLFRSTDNGLSWKKAKLPDMELGFVTGVTGHGSYLYMVTDREGLLRSRPDGSGWEHVPVEAAGGRIYTTWSHGATLYAYAKGGLFRSPDSGATWHPQGPAGSRGEAYLHLVSGSRLFEKTQNYGLNESRDNGATWKSLTIPQRVEDGLDILFQSGPNLIAYHRGSRAYLTRDFGASWSGPVGRPSEGLAETGGRLFASVGYGTYQYSEDHGVSWHSLPLPAGHIRATAFLEAQGGWLYSGSDSVYRRPATAESAGWQACPVLKPAPLPALPGNYFTRLIATGSLLFAGSWDGRWQCSGDSGNSWKPVDPVLQTAQPLSLAGGTAGSGGRVLVAATAHGLFRSPDGESGWIKVDAGWDDSVFCVLRHGAALFAGGAQGRIAYSLDEGRTWKRMDSLPDAAKVVSMAVQEGRLAVLSPYRGIWSTLLPEGIATATTPPAPRASAPGIRLRSAVMRPGDALDLVLSGPAFVRLNLLTVEGRRVAILRTGRLGAGRHPVRLDPARLRGIPRGRYLLELRAGEGGKGGNGKASASLFLDR